MAGYGRVHGQRCRPDRRPLRRETGTPHQRHDRSPLRLLHGVHFRQAARAIAEPPTRAALYAFYSCLVCQLFHYKFMITSLPPPRRHADRKHPSARRAAGRE